LDEPLSNLDALLERVRADIKQLFAGQSPCRLRHHDQTEAMTLSTKVAVLNNGYLQQLDPPERIYNHPASQFVVDFQMNLYHSSCQGRYAILGDFKCRSQVS